MSRARDENIRDKFAQAYAVLIDATEYVEYQCVSMREDADLNPQDRGLKSEYEKCVTVLNTMRELTKELREIVVGY